METITAHNGPGLMTVPEACDWLANRVSDSTLRREIRDGKLRVVRLRGRVLIDPADLAAWIEASKQPGGQLVSDSGPPGERPARKEKHDARRTVSEDLDVV